MSPLRSSIERVYGSTRYAPYMRFIEAQARHESADLTSRLAREDNNVMGMKVPSKRAFVGQPGRTAPDGGTYARYTSIDQAMQDLKLWFEYNSFRNDLTNVSDYAAELRKKLYYTDTLQNYSNALNKWLAKYP